jgi:hypothetical protein
MSTTEASTTGGLTVEGRELYTLRFRCWDTCNHPPGVLSCYRIELYRVTPVTAKRIYFTGIKGLSRYSQETEDHVDRGTIERDGRARCSKLRYDVYLSPPKLPDSQRRGGNGHSRSVKDGGQIALGLAEFCYGVTK